MASASSSIHPSCDTQDVVGQIMEKLQKETGDCLPVDHVSVLPEIKHVSFGQRDLSRLKAVWRSMQKKDEFERKYGYLAHLLFVPVDESMLRALLSFWDPAYKVFSLGAFDLTPTMEEYAALLRVESGKG